MQTQEYRRREYNGYLDEHPEFQGVIREWLESLELDPGGAAFDRPRLAEIECRHRDGFIPHSHNRGGYDLDYMSDVAACVGGGIGPSLKDIDRQEQQAYTEAKAWLKRERADDLAGAPDDKINYHGLYELGKSHLAEELSETEHEWMDSPVRWGVRAMYEGANSQGIHTLMIYCSGNVSEYYDFCGRGSETLAEFEVRFRTASGLRRQLEGLTSKVRKAF